MTNTQTCILIHKRMNLYAFVIVHVDPYTRTCTHNTHPHVHAHNETCTQVIKQLLLCIAIDYYK